jgi:hypothetical protein
MQRLYCTVGLKLPMRCFGVLFLCSARRLKIWIGSDDAPKDRNFVLYCSEKRKGYDG